jgi:hypothetical protein
MASGATLMARTVFTVAPPFPIIYRDDVWPGRLPVNNNGTLRLLLMQRLPYVTCHYTGAGAWSDFGDTIPEARSIEAWASSSAKQTPWEYNWIGDTQGNVLEYAGDYQAAHSAGENFIASGYLWLLGPGEKPSEAQILSFRKWRWWMLERQRLAVTHEVRGHKDMPGAATTCPGPDVLARWADLTTPWTPPPPDPVPEDDMARLIVKKRPPEGSPPHWPWLGYFDNGTVRPLISNDPMGEAPLEYIPDAAQYRNAAHAAGCAEIVG